MVWASSLQIQKHGHSGDFNFITLLVDILPLYAINLDD
ncbi:helicase-like protein, partial [Trifolium medium]|nr:helicase-like protein [Trifolium medium]